MALLLSRRSFRESVFKRDNYKCVFCGEPAVDAHHIMERRLFPDGGYYLDNGASVCAQHHLECETTEISIEEVLEACGIKTRLTPPHLYRDHCYDKWGNIITESGLRLKGELFHDESVQKILGEGGKLPYFVDYVKYPRTYHLPWSEGVTDDDRVMTDLSHFEGQEVIVSEKMDGECTSMYTDHIHARSIDGASHPSQDYVKGIWSKISYNIPLGWRVCGENTYAVHSIAYDNLEDYFLAFSIWNENNLCLSWDDTVEWCSLLGIKMVPVLYRGIFDEQVVKLCYHSSEWASKEGYVLRLSAEFSYSDFRKCVGKFVRKNHIQTVSHWRTGQRVVANKLKVR